MGPLNARRVEPQRAKARVDELIVLVLSEVKNVSKAISHNSAALGDGL